MNEVLKDRQSTDKQASRHTDADIVLALRPESRPTEIAPEARKRKKKNLITGKYGFLTTLFELDLVTGSTVQLA